MSRRFRRAWGEDLPYYERPGTTKGDPTVWSNPVVPPMSTEIPSDVFVDGSPSSYESSDRGENMATRTARRIAQDSVVFVATEEDMIGVLRDMGVKGMSLVAGEDDIKWQAVFFVGAAGAGKSWYNAKTYLKHSNFKLIDPDEVKKRHPNYDPERPYKLHEWSKEVSDNEFEQVVSSGDGDPVVVDGTGRDAEGIARKMELAKRNGYRTFLVYVWVPIEVSIFRNRNRSRFVPEKKIMDSFYEIERSFYKMRGMVDKYKVVLNSSSSDFAEAKADVDTYPPPQAVRPPRPGDADYGLARAANCRIGRIAAKVAAVRIGGQGGQV